MRKTFAAVILTLTLLGLAAVPASGAPIAVDCSSDPGALQPAIDAASPGRTVLISGTCVGDFVVSKNLTLKGELGATLKPLGDALGMVTVSAGATVALKGVALHDFDLVGYVGVVNFGTLSLDRVDVAGFFGTGVVNKTGGVLTVTRSTIRENGDDGGIGIDNAGAATIERSTINGNGGGGIGNSTYYASMTIRYSTISHNGLVSGSFGGIANGGTMLVEASTISGNSSDTGGGGIWSGGSLTLVSSTVSGNGANAGHGAPGNHGGGLALDGHYSILASTITGNFANEPSDDPGVPQTDGVAFFGGEGSIAATIIAGNLGADCGVVSPPSFTSGGYNLIGNGDGCGFTPLSTDLVGSSTGPGVIDAKLGALAPRGGTTETHSLAKTSPAVNWIPVGALASDGTPLCPASGSTDQRGKPRPQGGACDIGAYETKL